MRIGIDTRPLLMGSSGGIAQLVKGVCEHMFALSPNHQFFVFATPFNRGLIKYFGDNVQYFSLPLSAYFERLDQVLIEHHIDVLFRSYPTTDKLIFPRRKQIYLIPDIQHEYFPEFFSEEVLRNRRADFSSALSHAGAIATISEFALQTLKDFPGTNCTDIFIMEPALQDVHQDINEKVLSSAERKLIPKEDYFLFPANLWKHKNHESLLKAFQLFIETTGYDVRLILTGYPEGWNQLLDKFSGLPVTHLGFVSPVLVRALLEQAKALVFFSLYEGFGIPLLEAFDAETPVICSNTTSLPEVGGDAVLSCDPQDIEAIATLMERILVDNGLRTNLIRKGKIRLENYSWDKSALSLVNAFERVSNHSGKNIDSTIIKADVSFSLVTVVTPSYNQGRFLKRTIDSVLNQDYPNIEYIVFDGGSTDESVEILNSYGDKFYWVSEPDKGQTDAINKGMAIAKGEFLAYLNSDDVLLPGSISKVINFFNQKPDCDLVYGDAFYIDEDDHVTGNYRTADYSLDRLAEDCMVCQPAAFWRRRVKDKIGPFDSSLNYVMDYDYWLRLASQGGQIHFLPEHLACSRMYPENKTSANRGEIYKEIFKVCRKNIGYVHESYYQGYWHHLIYENRNLIGRILRRFPDLYKRVYKIHYKWSNYWFSDKKKNSGVIYRKTLVHLKSLLKAYKWRFLQKFKKMPLVNPPEVAGYWHDNWLAPEVTLIPKKQDLSQDFHLGGIAPIDTTMTIYSESKEIGRFNFLANQYETVKIPSEYLEDKLVNIRFSEFIQDAGSRRIAFLLQDTNLFSEKDI